MNTSETPAPEDVVSGPRRAPGTITVRKPVIALAAITSLTFLGLMLWIVVTRVSALTLSPTPANAQAPNTVVSAQPANIADLGIQQRENSLPTPEPQPLPTPNVSTQDLVGTAVTEPPLPSNAQPINSQPSFAQQQAELARATRQAQLQQAELIRQAAVNSEMNVRLPRGELRNGLQTYGNNQSYTLAQSDGQQEQSPYMLMRGMIIPATMLTSIDSTIPGVVVGMVSQDVYDSRHQVIVVPRGARLTGSYASGAVQGQRRLSVAWDSIQLPNNTTVDLQDMPGADLSGTSGFGAAVDNHTRQIFANVLLLSTLSAGAQLSQPQSSNCGSLTGYCQPSIAQQITGTIGANIANAGTTLLQRSASIPPTLHVVEGAQVAIMVVRNIPLQPWRP